MSETETIYVAKELYKELQPKIKHDKHTMAWIEFLNDKLHGRTFMNFEEFSSRLKGYQTEIHSVKVPIVNFVQPNEFGNYYQQYLNIKYGL